jgi:glycosyltransferase involved in cell wall biosynthesis
MPSVAVLIPTYNHGELLRHSVRSALWQTLQPSEILIVGDGVTVTTREVALDLAKTGPRIRFYDFPKGARLGEQHRNAALRDVNADIVCYLSDDDLWFPNHVETVAGLLAFADFASSLDLSVEHDQTITPGLVDLSKG